MKFKAEENMVSTDSSVFWLTNFQRLALKEVFLAVNRNNRDLEHLGIRHAFDNLSGGVEVEAYYLCGTLPDLGIEFWIYEDEAMFSYNGGDERFEKPDYSSEKALIEAFVERILKHLR